LLIPNSFEIGTENAWVIFLIAVLSVIISADIINGNREGIKTFAHNLSASETATAASDEFFNKTTNKNTAVMIDMPFENPSFIFGFVFFVIL
jgi:hypothetical protein